MRRVNMSECCGAKSSEGAYVNSHTRQKPRLSQRERPGTFPNLMSLHCLVFEQRNSILVSFTIA